MKIKGGYYIKARCIQDSEIARMPPYVREIWDWLLKEANHTEKKVDGVIIKRGQLIRSFKDIQKGLFWKVGYRKMSYKKWHCEKSMKFLREKAMIVTTKTTRGMFITICNYNYYQNPTNYESNNKATTRATVQKQLADTINKNDKNDKNKKRKINRKKKNTLLSRCALVIDYLNEKTGRNEEGKRKFDIKNDSTIRFLRGRFNEGRTVKDCIDVIDKKVKDWLSDEKMYKFLRPSTLFDPAKFENYINELEPDKYAKYYKKE